MEYDIFKPIPYARANSKIFFDEVKKENVESIEEMLMKNKYHVYDLDSVNLKKKKNIYLFKFKLIFKNII